MTHSRRLIRPLALLAIAGLLLGLVALPVQALPEECHEKCTPTTPCWIVCSIGSRVYDCGFWGVCAGGGFAATPPADELAFLDAPVDVPASCETTVPIPPESAETDPEMAPEPLAAD